MARSGWLIVLGLVLAPIRGVAGAGSCDVERALTGVVVAASAGTLSVATVDDGSAAGRGGLRSGDVVVQVNAEQPRSCAQWARAVEDARDDRLALLLLVRRGDAEVPLVLPAATWGVPEAPPATASADEEEEAVPGAPTPSVSKRFVEAPKPPPLPADEAVSVEGVVAAMAALAPEDDPPTNLVAYREKVLRIRREIETLAARQSAPEPVVADLRRVVRYYEAAAVAWEAVEGSNELDRRGRRMPVAENATVPYFTDSPQAAVIDEFDFLSATVSSEPSRSRFVEASGRWRPVWARILLWERGNREVKTLQAAS
ncbi:MAG TPA: PDZ domain-containing protein [Candidatus Binatia bacterium]|jgi:hypothetical protein|nr:PDZ domain-containing protein [Candidatus Binatia bacterium]